MTSSNICSLCSENNHILMYVDNNNTDNCILQQIQNVMPSFDILKFDSHLYVCLQCIETINSFYTIKQNFTKNIQYLKRISPKLTNNEHRSNLSTEDKSKDNKYECVICNEKFESKIKLIAHLKVHVIKKFECSICGELCTNEFKFKKHTLIHTKGVEYECPKCKQVLGTLNVFHKHIKTHENISHDCYKCGQKFCTKRRLIAHISNHANYVKCEICNKSFTTKYKLKVHIRDWHLNTKKHKCTECDKKFILYKNLENHMKSNHSKPVEQTQ